MVTEFDGLEVELELEAVGAIELLPVFVLAGPELPGPVEVFYASHFCSNLLRNLLEILCLFDKLL